MRMSIGWPVDGQADAAVLREPLLGDVEVAHDLDARDDAGDHAARDRRGARAARRRRGSARACPCPRARSGCRRRRPRRAWAMIELTSLMTGASSADSRISVTSAAPSSSSSSSIASATASSSCWRRGDQRRDVLGGGDDRAARRWPVMIEMSSTREHVGRVRHRDQQRASSIEADRDRVVALGRRRGIRLTAARSSLKTFRSRWSRPKRSAVARASWSLRDRAVARAGPARACGRLARASAIASRPAPAARSRARRCTSVSEAARRRRGGAAGSAPAAQPPRAAGASLRASRSGGPLRVGSSGIRERP